MMPVVRISEGNFERLQRWAEPLVDSADDALGKVLEVAELQRESTSLPFQHSQDLTVEQSQYADVESNAGVDSKNAEQRRLPTGRKVSNSAYERPILEGLYELGGSGRMSEVLQIVERKMKHLFTSVDYEILPSGTDVRWRNTAQWARNDLVHRRGLLKKDSDHGVWELTNQGVAEVENRQALSGPDGA